VSAETEAASPQPTDVIAHTDTVYAVLLDRPQILTSSDAVTSTHSSWYSSSATSSEQTMNICIYKYHQCFITVNLTAQQFRSSLMIIS